MCIRLSHEFLSGQTAELNKKVKELQGKMKKCPDDLKAQLKSFMAVSHFTCARGCMVVMVCMCVCVAGGQTDAGRPEAQSGQTYGEDE